MAMNGKMENGNSENPPALGTGVLKIVVVGEPLVGKTSFIQAYHQNHEPGERRSHNGVWMYPCEYLHDGSYGRVVLFEIPSNFDSHKEQRMPHYADAKAIVLMYAVDDPETLDLCFAKWLGEAKHLVEQKDIPVVLLGNKKDVRDDLHAIETMAFHGIKPLTYEQGSGHLVYGILNDFDEISTRNLADVDRAFGVILRAVLS